ncbi:MAG: DUF3795 domain-containing protein [candidate division WOR-3 bacterium]|nr:DUF3795 domain-containing protein [candidate division WOR-3 bacterium]MDH5683854.1 DUF3795 domain-containing protein [candidate division WOR-3 bacterium]
MTGKNLIGYCGLYCGACSFKAAYDSNDRRHIMPMPSKYDRFKNEELRFCPGCQSDKMGKDCKIRNCAVNRGLAHCGLCADFPCEIITGFNNDGIPHHNEAIKNLKQLRELGDESWLQSQEKQWTCECGSRFSWYVEKCLNCAKKRLD